MTDLASVVVSQPLPVVEAMVRDVASWAGLFADVEDVTRLARDRYAMQVRRGRRVRTALVQVRWQSGEHRFTWHSLSGPPWSGELRLVALTGRRTVVHLALDVAGRRHPPDRPRPVWLSRPAWLTRPVWLSRPAWLSCPAGPGSRAARRALDALRLRAEALPAPVRPQRLVPRQAVHHAEDVLTVAGARQARGGPPSRVAGPARHA